MSASQGTFTVPVWDEEPPSHPSTRAYFAPPKPKQLVPKAFPLVDFRSELSQDGKLGDASSPRAAALLSREGYTAVHAPTGLKGTADFQDGEKINDVYFPEMVSVLKKLTGCKDVFLHISAYRGPDKAHHTFDGAIPEGISKAEADKLDGTNKAQKPMMSKPLRLPHNDYTPLGARQSMRDWIEEVREHGKKAGVITREDEICAEHGLSSRRKESDNIIFQKYNDHAAGRLGPRYACYSMWRPIKPITRDPLALISYRELRKYADKQFVIWPYENRMRGFEGNDWHREFELLKIKPEAVGEDVPAELKFHYASNMQTDEILIFSLFDSAALGEGATESIGTMHGSPDLGEHGHGDERESLELRVLAFW